MSEQLLAMVIEAAIRATLLATLVGTLLWLLRIPRGAPRHTAWLIVVIAMILMPALQRVTPALPAPLSPRVPDFATLMPLPVPVTQPVTSAVATAVDPANAASRARSEPLRAESAQTNQPVSISRIGWVQLAAALYALIAVGLLLRVAFALGTVWTIYRRAQPIGNGLFESPSIVTPVTIGLVRPRIVLPMAWTDWPESTRLAVVAHERAHATRRDPLVALLTRLNSCVFWFHPLAWWLERTLADASEQACDEVGVQAVRHPRQYAEVLLTMATASQQAGGRIVWAGVSVEGRGRMSDRIERILLGRPASSMSHARKLLVVAGCVVAVTAAVACRSSQPPPAPLVAEHTPQRVEQQKEGERSQAVRTAAHAMTWEQATELQAQWRRNPEDLAAVEKLLFFYEPDISGKRSPDDPKKIAGRRPLILWLIEHHPDSELLRRIHGRIFASRLDWLTDPQGYEAAKKLWLAYAARPDASPYALRTAAWFLDVTDKPLAERLVLQGQSKEPGPSWTANLGVLYAQAILGSNRFTLFNVVNSTAPEAARGEFATRVRATLDATRDPVLLGATGSYLAINASQTKVDFDHRALARTYLNRAIQLDPKSQRARDVLDSLDMSDQFKKYQQLLAGASRESQPQLIAALPESERLPILVRQATLEYMGAESADWRTRHPQVPGDERPERIEENRQWARAAWQRSKKYAQDALDLAKRLPKHPDHADAVFSGTVALGANAFREGDRKTAVRYMRAAAEVPQSASSRPMSGIMYPSLEDRLIGPLLQDGERETVIQYFERSADERPADRERLLAAARAIRNGKLPSNYQRR